MRIKKHLILVSLIVIGSLSVGASYVGTRYTGFAVPITGSSINKQDAGQTGGGKAIVDFDKVLAHHPLWPQLKGIDEKIEVNRKLLAEALKSDGLKNDLLNNENAYESHYGKSASAFNTFKQILETEKTKEALEDELNLKFLDKKEKLIKEADLRTQKFIDLKESEFITYKRQIEDTYPRTIVNARLRSMVNTKGSRSELNDENGTLDVLNNKILSLIDAKRDEIDKAISLFKKEQSDYIESQLTAYMKEQRAVTERDLMGDGGVRDGTPYHIGQTSGEALTGNTKLDPDESEKVPGSFNVNVYYDKEDELMRRRAELKAVMIEDISDVFRKYCADHSLKAVQKKEPGSEYIDVTDKVIRLL